MKISPLDIRKQVFRKTMRGYDEQEVNAFLDLVAAQLEELLHENRSHSEKTGHLEVQLENYRKIEEALRNALVTAEKVARETKLSADQEVELTIKEAQLKAQRSVESARGVLQEIRSDMLDISKQRRDYLTKLRLLIETQLKMLNLKQIDFEDEDNLRRLDEIQRELFDSDGDSRGSGSPSSDVDDVLIAGKAVLDSVAAAERSSEALEESDDEDDGTDGPTGREDGDKTSDKDVLAADRSISSPETPA